MIAKKLGLDFIANFLNSRTLREKQLIIGFVVVFLFCVDYFLLIQPVIGIFSEVSPKVSPVKEELKALRDDQKNKDSITRKWENAKKELDEKERYFISPDETPALLENLSKEAQKSGVKITSLEPFNVKAGSKAAYTPLPIQVKANAGTHELGAFLARLENGQTFFKIADLRITANPLNERKHAVEMNMEVYKKDK
jgi:Tfp pilus assembly protein PilO